jgi:hypothetical protein
MSGDKAPETQLAYVPHFFEFSAFPLTRLQRNLKEKPECDVLVTVAKICDEFVEDDAGLKLCV